VYSDLEQASSSRLQIGADYRITQDVAIAG